MSLNLEQTTDFVIKRATDLVDRLVKSRGREEPPFLAEELAQLQGIKKIVKADLGKASALLLRSHEEYIIKVNQNHHPVRQNFSCAHEIGHTFVDELQQMVPRGNTDLRMPRSDIQGQAVERLCNIAAAELLMPEPTFKKYLSRFGLSVSSVEWLAHTFWVSLPAVAIRIAEVSEEPCIAILWQQSRGTKPGHRLAWCTGPGRESKEKIRYRPVTTYAREPSSVLKAYHDYGIIKSFKEFRLGNVTKRYYMESKGFGRNHNRYVVSLVFPDR